MRKAVLHEVGGFAESNGERERPSTELGGVTPAHEANVGARSLFSAIWERVTPAGTPRAAHQEGDAWRRVLGCSFIREAVLTQVYDVVGSEHNEGVVDQGLLCPSIVHRRQCLSETSTSLKDEGFGSALLENMPACRGAK